ncbi:MAG: class I SAM-dependent methyltransferase [Candidatus Melainabacteria bacterium]
MPHNAMETAYAAPEIAFGPCGEPCDSPCDSPCEGGGEAEGRQGWLQKLLCTGFNNAIDLCFDDVYAEPKTILMVGGCRQRTFAQRLALMLPGAEIAMVDPSEEEAVRAKQEICCRFEFFVAPMDRLPFEDGQFDLVLAHNLAELLPPQTWESGLKEVLRVAGKNVLLSHHRGGLTRGMESLLGLWPGAPSRPVQAALKAGGITLPQTPAPNPADVRAQLRQLAPQYDFTTELTPFPWHLYMGVHRQILAEHTARTA